MMVKNEEQWTRDSIFFNIIIGIPLPERPDHKTETELKKYKIFCSNLFFHPGGEALRLCNDGVKFLEKYHTSHTIDIIEFQKSGTNTSNMPSKHFVFLSRFCRKPYYIGMKKIIFFDEEEAFLFKLCDGDIDNVKTVAPEKLK